MKLQGVIILRITDLIRFFDLNEFWQHRDAFLRLLADPTRSPLFFDTDRQRMLYGRIVAFWLNGKLRPMGMSLDSARLTLYDNNFPTAIPLGQLTRHIGNAATLLSKTDLIGLTALYLMLGADDPASEITPDYEGFAAMRSGKIAGDFIVISSDIEFQPAGFAPEPPFSIKYIANLNVPAPLTVRCGASAATVDRGQCLTAVFSGEHCVALLPRHVSDPILRIDAELRANPHTRRADAIVHDASTQKRVIPGVTSLWLEPGHGIAYTSVAAAPVFPANATACRWRISDYMESHPDRKIIAVLSNEPQNYILYTAEHISH